MATGGTFLSRKLEQLLPGVKTKRYAALTFENGALVPTMADLESGAVEIVAQMMNEVGSAAILGSDAFDLPVVDVSVEEDRYKILMVGAGFSYTFDEERKAEKGNFPINNYRMMAARRAIAETHERLAAFGDVNAAITGVLNNASVTLNNSSFNPNTATPDELINYFVDEVSAMYAASNSVEMASMALVGTKLQFKLLRRLGETSDTVYSYIIKALSASGLNFSIKAHRFCDSANLERFGLQAGGTNKDRIAWYPLDPDVVERHIELPQLMPADWQYVKDGRKVFPMFSCTTPVIVNYPGAFRYTDHVKVA